MDSYKQFYHINSDEKLDIAFLVEVIIKKVIQ